MNTFGISRVEKKQESREWAEWVLGSMVLPGGSKFPVNSSTGLKGSAPAAVYNLSDAVGDIVRVIAPRLNPGKYISTGQDSYSLVVRVKGVDGESQELNLVSRSTLRGTRGLRAAGYLFAEQIKNLVQESAYAHLAEQGWKAASVAPVEIEPDEEALL